MDFLNKKSRSITINCGYGIGYSVLNIVNLSKKYIKKIKINFTKRRAGDVGQVYAKIEKLKKILKWIPKHNNIEQILKSSIIWEKKLSKSKKNDLNFKY